MLPLCFPPLAAASEELDTLLQELSAYEEQLRQQVAGGLSPHAGAPHGAAA